MSRNELPSWLRSQNSEYPRIFRVTGANQNAQKLPFTDLVLKKFILNNINFSKQFFVGSLENLADVRH